MFSRSAVASKGQCTDMERGALDVFCDENTHPFTATPGPKLALSQDNPELKNLSALVSINKKNLAGSRPPVIATS